VEAPLPDFRFAPADKRTAAFSVTGVDAPGPFAVRENSSTTLVKRYFVIFTCALYRCLHLEPLTSLSTDAFLMSFSRFLARNPRPKRMISDNGSQFIRGDFELRSLWRKLEVDKYMDRYPDIVWEFIPPRAPHVGGFYERLIQSVKRSLYATISPGTVNEEEFATALAITEGALNARPLGTHLSTDPADPAPLTPAHFKQGAAYADAAVLPEGERVPFTKRWHYIQTLLDRFWSRFVKEIIPHFHPLNEWTAPKTDLVAGDLVISLDHKLRGRWPIAKVTSVKTTGRDNRVRTVTVLFRGRHYERSVHYLLRLDATSVWTPVLTPPQSPEPMPPGTE
jgi:hypothetical protein